MIYRSVSVCKRLKISDKFCVRGAFFLIASLPSLSCSVIESEAFPAKSPDPIALQKIHPPVPICPSLFGHVIPPFKVTLYTFSSEQFLKIEIQGTITFPIWLKL